MMKTIGAIAGTIAFVALLLTGSTAWKIAGVVLVCWLALMLSEVWWRRLS